MQTITLKDAAPVTIEIASVIVKNQALLGEIDGATGDGDHGINMAKGFRLVTERLSGKSYDLREGLATISDTLLSDIGGSMGPLYGSFFFEMSEALDGTDVGRPDPASQPGGDLGVLLGEYARLLDVLLVRGGAALVCRPLRPRARPDGCAGEPGGEGQGE